MRRFPAADATFGIAALIGLIGHLRPAGMENRLGGVRVGSRAMTSMEIARVCMGYALVLVSLFTLVVIGSLLVARDALLSDYPPAVREWYGEQSPRGRRIAAVAGLLNFLVFAVVPVAGVLDLHDRAEGRLGFLPPFVLGTTGFLALTLFDLLVLDWLLFCTVRPRFMVLPGTEGMSEYRDRAFHLKVLIPRPVPWPLVAIPGYGAVVGGVAALVEAMTA